jgi:hypothetical protein
MEAGMTAWRFLALVALCASAACTPATPPPNAQATPPEPPALPSPPPGRDIAEPATYCGEGFSIAIQPAETVHVSDFDVGGSKLLYSTPAYPGVTLVTQGGHVGVHALGTADWAYSQFRIAYRDYLSGKTTAATTSGGVQWRRVKLHYDESGYNVDQDYAYVAVLRGGDVLALVSPDFDASPDDVRLVSRVDVGSMPPAACQ